MGERSDKRGRLLCYAKNELAEILDDTRKTENAGK